MKIKGQELMDGNSLREQGRIAAALLPEALWKREPSCIFELFFLR